MLKNCCLVFSAANRPRQGGRGGGGGQVANTGCKLKKALKFWLPGGFFLLLLSNDLISASEKLNKIKFRKYAKRAMLSKLTDTFCKSTDTIRTFREIYVQSPKLKYALLLLRHSTFAMSYLFVRTWIGLNNCSPLFSLLFKVLLKKKKQI